MANQIDELQGVAWINCAGDWLVDVRLPGTVLLALGGSLENPALMLQRARDRVRALAIERALIEDFDRMRGGL